MQASLSIHQGIPGSGLLNLCENNELIGEDHLENPSSHRPIPSRLFFAFIPQPLPKTYDLIFPTLHVAGDANTRAREVTHPLKMIAV